MIDIEYVKKNIKKGWILNPNEKVVNGIIKGLNRCNGECPCSNNSREKQCCCNLYIKEQTTGQYGRVVEGGSLQN